MPSVTLQNAENNPALSLRVGLWVAQFLICAFFCYAAVMKVFMPIPTLAAMWPWTGQLPVAFVRSLGVIDLLGGLGVLLPSLTRVRPSLALTATLWTMALQICAVIFHVTRGEIIATPVNAIVLGLLVFIFWGRRKAPIQAR